MNRPLQLRTLHRRRTTDLLRDTEERDPARRRLSAREREIALLIAEGLKDIVIARRLGLAVSTVHTHSRRMQFRLGLTSRTALLDWVAARYTPGHPEAGLHRGPDLVTSANASRLRA